MVEQRAGYDKLDELVFESKICCRIARRNTQFSIDGAQVSVDSTRADDQRFSNLGIGQSSCDQPQHLHLTLGESMRGGWRRSLMRVRPSFHVGFRWRSIGDRRIISGGKRLLGRHHLSLGQCFGKGPLPKLSACCGHQLLITGVHVR